YSRQGALPAAAHHRCSKGAVADNRKYGAPMVTARSRSISPDGCCPIASGVRGMIGRDNKEEASRTPCTIPCVRVFRIEPSQWAYKYPPSKAVWKNTRQTLQTAGAPPNQGRIKRPIIGCI